MFDNCLLGVACNRLFEQLSIPEPHGHVSSDRKKDLTFDSRVFLLAASLDPHHSFQWVQDHPGSDDEKAELKNQITGCLII